MKIALASDHAGYDLKNEISGYLTDRGIEILDLGCRSGEKVDYVDYGAKAARSVVSGECDRAILFCGSSLGMAIVANKFRGIRATPCWNEYSAEMSRRHNDSNCLALGERVLSKDEARRIVSIWLDTEFEGGRHASRIAKISAIESELYKS